MKLLKNNLLLLILTILSHQLAHGQVFNINLLKNSKEKEKITNIITSKNNNFEVVKNQITSITNGTTNFLIAPIISTEEKSGGCYLQYLNSDHQAGERYLIEKNEDVQSCDAVIAVFGCRLPKENGIGVVTGIRLGSNNYYEQSSFFDISKNNELRKNPELSKKIASFDSAAKAKRKLGCLR